MRKLKSLLPDIFSLIVLVFLGITLLDGLQNRVDIQLTDDTGYLTLGLRITNGVLAGFGPLYSLIFKVFKQIFDDPVQLYYAVFSILSIAPAVCVYIFLRSWSVNPIYALIISELFLFSGINMSFFTWSRISHFAICIILLWGALMTRIKEPFQVLFSLVFISFLLGYVRPEFHLSWYASSILLLLWWVVVRQFKITSREAMFMVPSAVFMLLFFYFIGNPMEGNRTYTAFAQQFSYNYCEWKNLNNYDWIQWADITQKEFGKFETLSQAYANNPDMFQKHILYNIQQYFFKAFAAVRGIFFPESVVHIHSTLAWIIIGILLFMRIIHVGPGTWTLQIWRLLKRHYILVFGILLLAVPSVVASLVFYTREHYLLLQMPLFFLLIALILAPESAKVTSMPAWLNFLLLPVTAVVLWLASPGLKDYKTYDVWEEYTYPSNKKTIEALRVLNFQQPVNELDHEGGFFIYMGRNYKWVSPFKKEGTINFEAYLKKENINMVYVTKALLSNPLFRKDPSFQLFISSPESFGFKKVNLEKENKGYLLIQQGLK